MKRSNATNNAKEATGITASTKLYQLRSPAKRSKQSTSTNKNSVQGTKKFGTNDNGKGHSSIHSNAVIDDSRPRRSSVRLGLGSRSSSNIVQDDVQNARTKRTTSNDSSNIRSSLPLIPPPLPPPPASSSSSSSPPLPTQLSTPPSSLSSSPPLIKKTKKVTKRENNKSVHDKEDEIAHADNGRKVRVPKTISRDNKKNGVGKSNHKINGSHNNNDHNNVVVNSVDAIHDTSSIDDDKTLKSNSTTKLKSKQINRVRTKRRYICNFCDKEFLGGNDLRKHIRIHTNERPFECPHCRQRFRQGGCLKNHIASQHGTSETFTCYYCNKTFPIKERLRLHMRLHSGEKP